MTGALCAAGIFRVTHSQSEYDDAAASTAHVRQIDVEDVRQDAAGEDAANHKTVEMTTVNASHGHVTDSSSVAVTVEPGK